MYCFDAIIHFSSKKKKAIVILCDESTVTNITMYRNQDGLINQKASFHCVWGGT